MDDIMLKREAATEFFERDRRDLYEECYRECCSWVEVRKYYKDNREAVRTSKLWFHTLYFTCF